MIRTVLMVAAVLNSAPAAAIDLLDIYREAKLKDTRVAIAKARYRAAQERVPQALAGVQPTFGSDAAVNTGRTRDDIGRALPRRH